MFPSQLFVFESLIVSNFMSMLVLTSKLRPHTTENLIRLVRLAGHKFQDRGGCNLIGSLRWYEYTLVTDKNTFTYEALFCLNETWCSWLLRVVCLNRQDHSSWPNWLTGVISLVSLKVSVRLWQKCDGTSTNSGSMWTNAVFINLLIWNRSKTPLHACKPC